MGFPHTSYQRRTSEGSLVKGPNSHYTNNKRRLSRECMANIVFTLPVNVEEVAPKRDIEGEGIFEFLNQYCLLNGNIHPLPLILKKLVNKQSQRLSL
eukprot:1194661-Prorocentrum_minimum.AAC.10